MDLTYNVIIRSTCECSCCTANETHLGDHFTSCVDPDELIGLAYINSKWQLTEVQKAIPNRTSSAMLALGTRHESRSRNKTYQLCQGIIICVNLQLHVTINAYESTEFVWKMTYCRQKDPIPKSVAGACKILAR